MDDYCVAFAVMNMNLDEAMIYYCSFWIMDSDDEDGYRR